MQLALPKRIPNLTPSALDELQSWSCRGVAINKAFDIIGNDISRRLDRCGQQNISLIDKVAIPKEDTGGRVRFTLYSVCPTMPSKSTASDEYLFHWILTEGLQKQYIRIGAIFANNAAIVSGFEAGICCPDYREYPFSTDLRSLPAMPTQWSDII